MSVLTLDEAKQQLNIAVGDQSLDDELGAYIAAVDEVIERQTRQVVTSRPVTERHTVQRQDTLVLHHRPATALASVARVDGTRSWDVADLDLDPVGIVRTLHGGRFDGLVRVEYTAGYADDVIPDNFRLAARIILQHLWQTQRGQFGAPRAGGMDYSPTPGRGYAIPNAALELLGTPGPVFA